MLPNIRALWASCNSAALYNRVYDPETAAHGYSDPECDEARAAVDAAYAFVANLSAGDVGRLSLCIHSEHDAAPDAAQQQAHDDMLRFADYPTMFDQTEDAAISHAALIIKKWRGYVG